MNNEQGVQGCVRSGKKMMVKGLLSSLAAIAIIGSASAAQAANYIDYFGDDLFLGLAYHRFGCLDNDVTITSDREYDGFTNNNYCIAGQAWNAPQSAGYVYLNFSATSGAAQLDACGASTNTAYGTANYSPTSTTCSYNVLTNCNSDCWIQKFSTCQGKRIDVLSPCF